MAGKRRPDIINRPLFRIHRDAPQNSEKKERRRSKHNICQKDHVLKRMVERTHEKSVEHVHEETSGNGGELIGSRSQKEKWLLPRSFSALVSCGYIPHIFLFSIDFKIVIVFSTSNAMIPLCMVPRLVGPCVPLQHVP